MYKFEDMSLTKETLNLLKYKKLIDSFEFSFIPNEQMVIDLAENCNRFSNFYACDLMCISVRYQDILFKYGDNDASVSYLNGKIKYELKRNSFDYEEEYEKAKKEVHDYYKDIKVNGRVVILI